MKFSKKQKFYAKNASVLFLAASMAACSQGGDSGGNLGISGTVTAPSGDVAFNVQEPSALERFASIFGTKAHAAVSGVTAVGAGVTVELIEVDASGNKVGATIETTTTDADGKYTLFTDKSANSKYVVRATGTTESMDIRFAGFEADVNPVSDAVSDLITAATDDLSKISVDELTEITEAVDGIVSEIDPTGLTISTLAKAIRDQVNNNEELSNQLSSTSASEQICGNVKDAASANLSNIKIIVKDYNENVTFAKTKTDSSGNYCVNVAAGDYIIGAFNFTTASTAASEWWSTSGTKYTPFDATKVTVAAAATVTKNFALEAGARLTGTVTAATASGLTAGAAVEGAKVTARQYTNYLPISSNKVKANGTYILNVIPGDYRIEAKNQSRYDYASEVHNGDTGTVASFEGTKVTLSAGTTTTLDFALDKGYKISGTILDNATNGSPVKGLRIKVNLTDARGASFRLRTNKEGKYRIWLKPDTYSAESYGTSGTVDMSSSNQTVDLSTQVGKVTLTVKDSDGNPVSQAKVFLRTSLNASINQEITKADGTVTLYSPTTAADNKLYLRIDDSHDYASSVYGNQEYVRNGSNISMTVGSTTALGDMTLPAAGTLKVIVTSDGTTAVGNFRVDIRDGGTDGTFKFISGRTLSSGQFELSVPARTYNRIRMKDDSANCDSVSVTAGATTTLNYRTDTNTCTVS